MAIHSLYKILIFGIIFCVFILKDATSIDAMDNRYIFDLGSSTIKVKGYKVNSQTNEIVALLPKYTKKVSHKQCVLLSADGSTLSNRCLRQTIKAISDMQSLYNVDCKSAACIGIATAWARDTSNIKYVLREIRHHTGVDIIVISQNVEGMLAFQAATSYLKRNSKSLKRNDLVFDIGGGSFQLIGSNEPEKPFVFKGHHGTESMMHQLNHKFKAHDNQSYIACEDLPGVYNYLDNIIGNEMQNDKELSQFISKKINKVYGISMLLRNSELNNQDNHVITIEDLNKMNLKLCGLSYEKSAKLLPRTKDSGYLATFQSGLILLESIMKHLGISEMHILDADLQDYIATTEKIWIDQEFYGDIVQNKEERENLYIQASIKSAR